MTPFELSKDITTFVDTEKGEIKFVQKTKGDTTKLADEYSYLNNEFICTFEATK